MNVPCSSPEFGACLAKYSIVQSLSTFRDFGVVCPLYSFSRLCGSRRVSTEVNLGEPYGVPKRLDHMSCYVLVISLRKNANIPGLLFINRVDVLSCNVFPKELRNFFQRKVLGLQTISLQSRFPSDSGSTSG